MFNLDLQLKKILLKAPLLKSYVDWLTFKSTQDVNTGATDGKVVYYNPINLAKRDELSQQFTLIHEILHVALNHNNRRQGRELNGFNYACDAVINQMIKKMGIPIPEGSINCDEAINYNVEEYYDLIRSRDNYDDLMNSIIKNSKNDVITTHKYWNEPFEDKNNKDNKQDKDMPDNTSLDEKDFQEKNEKLRKKMEDDFYNEIKKDIDNSIHSEVNKQLSDIGESTSFVSWQELLRYEIKKNKADYDFFNGEFDENGLWYYKFQNNKENEAEVEILIDSSYSVEDELVKAFLREVKSIVENAKISIACFNDKVDDFISIEDENDIDNFVITSRGGTDFEAAVKAFQSPTSIKIIFTDGYALDPTSFCEAIWIVYSDAKINPPGGFVYHVNKKDLESEIKNR